MENMTFQDSVQFFPCSLSKLLEAFGQTASKPLYAHYFSTKENLDYFGPIPDVSYYGENEMNVSERKDFLDWSEGQKAKVFITSAC